MSVSGRTREIPEHSEIKMHLRGMPRSSLQLNALFESDTEILKIGAQRYLVASTDTVGEEIAVGLYRNPETWGWMTVMASVSDLAASGTKPLGLLLSTQWKFETEDEVKKAYFGGVKKALRSAKIPLLGGDSGSSLSYSFTATILGERNSRPLMRTRIQEGDLIALVGKKRGGIGPCLAHRLLQRVEDPLQESAFRPRPDWQTVHRLRPRLRASIDTSDGVATALATLASVNKIGFELNFNPRSIDPRAIAYCERQSLPLEILWMFDHGDFQPLVVIPKSNASILSSEKELVLIGVAKKKRGITLDGRRLRANAITECARDFDSLRFLVQGLVREWS